MTRCAAFSRAARDRSGAALIELALVAPILLALLLGMYDLGPAMMVRFKLASATQAVADIATQSATMQISDVVNYFSAGSDVMTPFSSSSLSLRITNVASNGLGAAFVYWSCGQGALPALDAASFVTNTPTGTPLKNLLVLAPDLSGTYSPYIPAGTNTSFIMVESQYTFTPPAGFVIRSAQTLTNTAYAMPRVSTYVAPSNGLLGFIPIPPTPLTIGSYSRSQSGVTCKTGLLTF